MGKGWAAYSAAVGELFAPDFVAHKARGEDIQSLKNFKQGVRQTYNNFPDFHGILEDIVVKGDKVMRYTSGGTHKATNKKVTMWAISIDRVVGGKIAELWARADTVGEMQQLGLTPARAVEAISTRQKETSPPQIVFRFHFPFLFCSVDVVLIKLKGGDINECSGYSAAYYIVAATGVLVAAVYYVMNLQC